jgi:hypothetical protein
MSLLTAKAGVQETDAIRRVAVRRRDLGVGMGLGSGGAGKREKGREKREDGRGKRKLPSSICRW